MYRSATSELRVRGHQLSWTDTDWPTASDWVRPLGLGAWAAALVGSSLARIGSSDDRSGFVTGQPYDAAVDVAAERPLW